MVVIASSSSATRNAPEDELHRPRQSDTSRLPAPELAPAPHRQPAPANPEHDQSPGHAHHSPLYGIAPTDRQHQAVNNRHPASEDQHEGFAAHAQLLLSDRVLCSSVMVHQSMAAGTIRKPNWQALRGARRPRLPIWPATACRPHPHRGLCVMLLDLRCPDGYHKKRTR